MSFRVWSSLFAITVVLFVWSSNLTFFIPGYSLIRNLYPWYISASFGNLIEIISVYFLACILLRKSNQNALRTLGLAPIPSNTPVVILTMVAPLYLIFALNFDLAEIEPLKVIYLAVISPVYEEIMMRGFVFGFLRQVVKWKFWLAALLTGTVFGAVHFDQSMSSTDNIMTIAITGLGGVLFAWLFEKWDSLWVPIGLHVTMNLAWNLFTVGEGAFAGSLPTIMQFTTALLAITITLLRGRIPIFRNRISARVNNLNSG